MRTIERSGRGRFTDASPTPRIKVMTSQHGQVLYDLHGASMTIRDGRAGEETTIEVLHPTGTDFEHDSARIVRLTLYGVTFKSIWAWGEVDFTGYLHEAYYYDDGVDPAALGDEVEGVPGGRMCEPPTCDEPHPIMAYQPPKQKQTKGPVWIEVIMFEPKEEEA